MLVTTFSERFLRTDETEDAVVGEVGLGLLDIDVPLVLLTALLEVLPIPALVPPVLRSFNLAERRSGRAICFPGCCGCPLRVVVVVVAKVVVIVR